jgi:hypothetical protein
MAFRSPKWAQFVVSFVLVLLSASAAHAQRIPDVVIWSAGASVFAPFVAVPVKLGILGLLNLEAPSSRLWSISAIEWLLWFPVCFISLRYGRSSSVPLIVLALFAAAIWIHRARLANTSWKSALFLSIPTPVLALALPFLALSAIAFVESISG